MDRVSGLLLHAERLVGSTPLVQMNSFASYCAVCHHHGARYQDVRVASRSLRRHRSGKRHVTLTGGLASRRPHIGRDWVEVSDTEDGAA